MQNVSYFSHLSRVPSLRVISLLLSLTFSVSAWCFGIEDYSGKKPLDWNDDSSPSQVQIYQKVHHVVADMENLTLSFFYQLERYSRGGGLTLDYAHFTPEQEKKLETLSILGLKRKILDGSAQGMVIKFEKAKEMLLVKELLESMGDHFVLMLPTALLLEITMGAEAKGEEANIIEWKKIKNSSFIRLEHMFITKLGSFVSNWSTEIKERKKGKEKEREE